MIHRGGVLLLLILKRSLCNTFFKMMTFNSCFCLPLTSSNSGVEGRMTYLLQFYIVRKYIYFRQFILSVRTSRYGLSLEYFMHLLFALIHQDFLSSSPILAFHAANMAFEDTA